MECEKGELHLKLEHSAVEVLNAKNEPCKPGETGRVVCTGFGNTAFPLIRYEIGDEATLSSKQQSLCGRSGILLERILGRLDDYIATPDGRLVGRLDHLFKDSKNVVEAQLAQDSLNEVLLRIVKGPQFSTKDEHEIEQAARLRLGPSIRIRFQYVDQVPRTKGGKVRFIDSTLDQKELLKGLIS
jgi:phenylacetate-CoA ligase